MYIQKKFRRSPLDLLVKQDTRNPGVDANGDFVYYNSEIVYSFASDSVFTKRHENYPCHSERYVNGLSYGGQDEIIFETLSFLCFELSGSHAIKSLAIEDVISIVISELVEILPGNRNWMSTCGGSLDICKTSYAIVRCHIKILTRFHVSVGRIIKNIEFRNEGRFSKARKSRKSTFIPKLSILYYPAYRDMKSGDSFYVTSTMA
jgi:hypothetical protein